MPDQNAKSTKPQGSPAPPAADEDPWEAARAAGIDVSLIEANLRKTPDARLRAHNGALALAAAIREAVERRNG